MQHVKNYILKISKIICIHIVLYEYIKLNNHISNIDYLKTSILDKDCQIN